MFVHLWDVHVCAGVCECVCKCVWMCVQVCVKVCVDVCTGVCRGVWMCVHMSKSTEEKKLEPSNSHCMKCWVYNIFTTVQIWCK